MERLSAGLYLAHGHRTDPDTKCGDVPGDLLEQLPRCDRLGLVAKPVLQGRTFDTLGTQFLCDDVARNEKELQNTPDHFPYAVHRHDWKIIPL